MLSPEGYAYLWREPTPSGLYHPGWRRELGDSEVAEAYMGAKFGGEGADMVEIVGEGGRAALRCFARGSCSCSSRAHSACSLPLLTLALVSRARTGPRPVF